MITLHHHHHNCGITTGSGANYRAAPADKTENISTEFGKSSTDLQALGGELCSHAGEGRIGHHHAG